MTYKVTTLFIVKTKQGDLTLNPGQTITLVEEKAKKLLTEGKIKPMPSVDDLAERMAIMGENCAPEEVKPYVTDFDSLVIPWNSNPQYHYWKKGGQSPCQTLKELGRCDLIGKYKSLYCN